MAINDVTDLLIMTSGRGGTTHSAAAYGGHLSEEGRLESGGE